VEIISLHQTTCVSTKNTSLYPSGENKYTLTFGHVHINFCQTLVFFFCDDDVFQIFYVNFETIVT